MKKAGLYLTIAFIMTSLLGGTLVFGLYMGSVISKLLFGFSIMFNGQ